MAFRVGQKVVCVNDTFSEGWRDGELLPVQGQVYTVRDVLDWTFGDGVSYPALRLVEITCAPREWKWGGLTEHPFWGERFRPIVEKKTDISIFTEILHKATKRQDA